MTDTITSRVVRTSLSLLTLCACGTAPVLTAAVPGAALARPLIDGDPSTDAGPDQFLRCLDRPGSCSGAVPAPVDGLFAPPAPPPSHYFIEDAAARLRGDAGLFCAINADSPIDRDATPVRPLRSTLSFTEGGPPAAPLFLYDWSAASADPWTPRGLRHDGPQRVADAKTDADWGALTSKVKLRERDDPLDPSLRNTWETDESLRLPVAGPLFLFGQLGGSSPSAEQRQLKWLGKTGIGVKLKPWLLQEVQVRGGPAVRYDSTTTLSPGQSPERSELFLEAVTKVPLPVVGPLNVEYTGYAVPAATPTDRNQINQDFKLAVPLSSGGQFHVGAKYRWENVPSSTPWVDRMELYMGVQLKR
jgi:hypothetical protein